jgi:cyclase
MKNIRIIPRLDIKGPNLVKGIHLEGLRVLGKPEDFAKYYYENGADELFYQDVVASLYDRNSLNDIISKTARKSFIPLTVGGGIRTIQNINDALRAGADKVCINTAAIKNPEFVREAVKKFGSSTIVIAIEAIQQDEGKYFAFIDNGREFTGVDVFKWANQVTELGAGEVLITSVDREGTGKGFDIDLVKRIAKELPIPVIAHGGAGKISDFVDVVENGKADGIAVSSVVHYDFISNYQTNMENRDEGNISFLENGKYTFKNISVSNIKQIKEGLVKSGKNCR